MGGGSHNINFYFRNKYIINNLIFQIMNKKFKPGDIVRLKSGGPAMTVEKYFTSTIDNSEDNVVMYYFTTSDGGEQLCKKESFKEDMLKLVNTNS